MVRWLVCLLFQNGLNEYLNIDWLLSLEDAQDKIDKWCLEYPH
ncbi:transposase [Salmonella enterica subsp. enterica serovar Tennessee]|nr:transposase [Salmonella enterica subsp. enterica]ECF4688306.1 transposase [Salmonella enterica subsp. enterica serovar Tennessee]ECT6635012.1 transposase [Salmonella enterica subsp. enterica serovar Rissen]EDQ1048086.1 transposase [Salmonella enterica subsp. houtenae]ECH7616327.1 transposase [Salmonella enterica subsp. enterica serovar Tennessee]